MNIKSKALMTLLVPFMLPLTGCGFLVNRIFNRGNNNGQESSAVPGPHSSENDPEDTIYDKLDGWVFDIYNSVAMGTMTINQMYPERVDESNRRFLVYSETEKKNYRVSDIYVAHLLQTTVSEGDNEFESSKTVIPHDGQISFASYEGFTYSIYDEDYASYVIRGIQDNDYLDENPIKGIVTISGLNEKPYLLRYRGYGHERGYSQDNLDGYIDQCCVTNDFTFISFNKKTEGYYNNNDYYNYFNDYYHRSYVIYNKTGYIYPLNNGSQIRDIYDDYVVLNNNDKNIPCALKINENNEIYFEQIVKNLDIHVYEAFKDKYGNFYIRNDSLDIIDYEGKTYYYTERDFFISDDLTVIYVNKYYDSSSKVIVKKMDASFNKVNIASNETFSFERKEYVCDYVPRRIENDFLYYAYASIIERYNLVTNEFTSFKSYENTPYCALDYHTVLLWSDGSGTNKLFYGDTYDNPIQVGYDYEYWNPEAGQYETRYVENNAYLIAEDIMIDEWDSYFEYIRFKYVTLTETYYYRVILDENNKPILVSWDNEDGENDRLQLTPVNR